MLYSCCIFLFSCSISNGLLVSIGGTLVNTDVLIVYMANGRVFVNFTPDSNGLSPGYTLGTSSAYNDTILHKFDVTFSSGQLSMSIDDNDRQLTIGKSINAIN